jgi:hypothetical protein
VDTELARASVESTEGNRGEAMETNALTAAEAGLPHADYTAASMKRARVALGEYARTSGIYDPVDVLTFTRLCIEQATANVSATNFDADEALLNEVLRIASASCGVCKMPKGGSMEPQTAATSEPAVEVPATISTMEAFVATVGVENTPVVAVPPSHERAMPAQPLGELPDVRPARLWNSFVQATVRGVWSLVQAMFVRSE